MLAKILVGVVAAIAVTGVGVYYAMPDYSQPGCCGKSAGTLATPVADITECPVDGEPSSCCAARAVPVVSEGASCCAVKAATSTDSLGACVGGMALTNAAPTAKAKHCCEE